MINTSTELNELSAFLEYEQFLGLSKLFLYIAKWELECETTGGSN